MHLSADDITEKAPGQGCEGACKALHSRQKASQLRYQLLTAVLVLVELPDHVHLHDTC